MAVLVKICGLSTPETLDAALDAGADMVGLVFYARSPRHVMLSQANRLAAQARGRAMIVALVVDVDDVTLNDIRREVHPDLWQLHGRETIERARAIRMATGTPVMKAIGIRSAADVAEARLYLPAADRLLLDAKPPADPSALPGGNGLTFDWRLVADLSPPLPFMLSGGLTPETVATAIGLVRPQAVDVSSGVESAPGVKDVSKIRAFLTAVRAANA
jgi:phosphoribosylanthranilate isomerase